MESTQVIGSSWETRHFAQQPRGRSPYPVSATADGRELPARWHLLYNSAGYPMRTTPISTTATCTAMTTTQTHLRTG